MNTILFYNSKDEKFDINNKKYINMIKIPQWNFLTYTSGGIVNPPFVDKIMVLIKTFTEDQIYQLYNTLKINGKLCLINTPNYIKIFKEYFIINKFIIITRKTNFTYIIPRFRVVEFIIMGVQKAGTTALAYNISKHPDIYINAAPTPLVSEIHFFSRMWTKGVDYYKTFFNYSKKIVGEKTPNYIYLPHVYPLIQKVNPNVKLIIVLRNPITRAYSHWKMGRERYNSTPATFEEAIEYDFKYTLTENKTAEAADHHYINRGLYYEQLIELFKWFPRQNILILIQEDILLNMHKEYNKVYNFLNLDELNSNINYEIVFKTKDEAPMDIKTYNKLKNYYEPSIVKLENLLNIKTNWLK